MTHLQTYICNEWITQSTFDNIVDARDAYETGKWSDWGLKRMINDDGFIVETTEHDDHPVCGRCNTNLLNLDHRGNPNRLCGSCENVDTVHYDRLIISGC